VFSLNHGYIQESNEHILQYSKIRIFKTRSTLPWSTKSTKANPTPSQKTCYSGRPRLLILKTNWSLCRKCRLFSPIPSIKTISSSSRIRNSNMTRQKLFLCILEQTWRAFISSEKHKRSIHLPNNKGRFYPEQHKTKQQFATHDFHALQNQIK